MKVSGFIFLYIFNPYVSYSLFSEVEQHNNTWQYDLIFA